MDETILDKLILNSDRLKGWAGQFTKKRALFEEILRIDPQYYVGIRGLRGVGKTVMLLQIADTYENSAYFSADSLFLKPFSIYQISESLRKRGYQNIFIDEIHTRPEWEKDLKTLFDEHQCRVLFSGSSSIGINDSCADLSRRALIHDLKPISFREFLNLRKGFDIPVLSWREILEHTKQKKLPYVQAHEYMDEYMRWGGMLYPNDGFEKALENSVKKIISLDMASLRDINIKYENDAYRLLYLVAASPPFELSYSSISSKLGLTKTFLIRLVDDLQAAGLLKVLFPCRQKNQNLIKEPKIYLTIPFRHLLCKNPEKGSLREEFFVNHTNPTCYFKTQKGEKTPDFLVDGSRVEVGGSSKKNDQSPDYIAVDSLDRGGNKIPLYLFGFLY